MTRPNITAEDVRRLGELAKLNLSPDEQEKLTEELSAILGYFDIVDEVSDDVTIDQPSEEPSELRPDVVAPSSPESVMKGVPQKKGDLVRAPRVF